MQTGRKDFFQIQSAKGMFPMQKSKAIAVIAAVSSLATAATATALAGAFSKPTVTCPNCGTEIECDIGQKGERTQHMSLDEYKASLTEKVAAGELTQAEADEKSAAFEERQQKMEQRMKEKKAELDEKVASGEMTQEEADRIQNGKGGRGRHAGSPDEKAGFQKGQDSTQTENN